jgi:serine/threonine-protein kinase
MPDSRYRITERIAAGGMAEVFRGVAESLQGFRKSVAIKRVLPALSKNRKFIAMFLDEARVSLHLQHANIVQVFDIGHADETYFIVMEYVDGVDLKAVLEWRRRINKPLTIGQTVYVIMEVCKGLAYAHELLHPETGRPLGIVHRDVSPPNVLLSKNGEVKVADFGLAKAAVQVETTDPGVVKGKMSYLSPEAARGEEVDQRADIFAVGILLYEMLTGKRLFYGESDYQTVELVRAAKIPPIAPQNPEVEPELEEIVRKSLARRADDRFQSATDLQDALAHYLFSRGLKMIQRDIGELVRGCLEDQATLSGAARRPKTNIIDTLLQDEIQSFISIEDAAAAAAAPSESPPPGMSAIPTAVTGEDFIDPRAWAEDPDWPSRRATGAVPLHQRAKTGAVRRLTGAVKPLEPTLGAAEAVAAAAASRRGSGLPALASDPMLDPAAGLPAPGTSEAPIDPRVTEAPTVLDEPLPNRAKGRGLVIGIGVVLVALAVGAAIAAAIVG